MQSHISQEKKAQNTHKNEAYQNQNKCINSFCYESPQDFD